MTINVKTYLTYWFAFARSKPKFLLQLKEHEIRFHCLHQGQIW